MMKALDIQPILDDWANAFGLKAWKPVAFNDAVKPEIQVRMGVSLSVRSMEDLQRQLGSYSAKIFESPAVKQMLGTQAAIITDLQAQLQAMTKMFEKHVGPVELEKVDDSEAT